MFLCAESGYTQEEEEEQYETSGVKAIMSGIFGTVTVDGAQWQRMALRPLFTAGRFEALFDIELFIDERGQFRDRGWNFDSGTQGFESILRKISYLQFGGLDWEDPFYLRIGSLEDVTLGYGLILSGYRNTLEAPGVKKTGLDIAVRGISSWSFGIRAIINDFVDLSKGGPLVGVRVSARPVFRPQDMEVGRLEFGMTGVSDIDQYEGLRNSLPVPRPPRDGITMAGLDASYLIWDREFSELILYGQYARIVEGDGIKGEGFGAPGLKLKLGPLKGRAEYRQFSDQFRPQYFNDLYENARARYDETNNLAIPKTATLSDTSMKGIYGQASLSLGPLMTASASYQHLKGQGASNQRLLGMASLNAAFLGKVPYFSQASAYYEKYNIDTRQARFFDSTLDTFYGYILSIDISQDVSVIWDTRHTFSPGTTTPLKRNKLLNIQAVAHF